jgi:drug/metabolite transporter (DMT)-like permease
VVVGLGFLLQTMGLTGSSASNTGLITGLFVVFAPLANRVLFQVKVPARLWLGIAASLAGLALLTGAGAGGLARGDLLTLGCAALFGLHVALLDRFARGRDAGVLALGQVGAAAALLVAAWQVHGGLALPPREAWFALVITGVFASAGAYLVQTYAQQRLSAVEAGLIMVLEPLFAVLFGVLLHGDRLTALQAAGGALMMGTMVTLEWISRRRAHL